MKLETLKEFVIVAKHLNFTKAAKKLYTTQPGLSSRISSLEKDIGYPLFDRTRSGVVLTSAGNVFLDYAQRILDLYQEAQVKVEAAAQNISIKVASISPTSPYYQMLPERDDLTYTFVDLDLNTSAIDAVHEGIVDIAMETNYSVIPEFDDEAKELGISYYGFDNTECIIAMMASHPLAQMPSLSRVDLQGQTIVIHSGTHFDRWSKMIKKMIGGDISLSFRLNALENVSNLSVADLGTSLYICGGDSYQQHFASRSNVRVYEEIDGEALLCPAALIYRTDDNNKLLSKFIDEFTKHCK